MVYVVHKAAALEQGLDLLGSQKLAGLDRGLAGDHVQELGDEGVARRLQGLRSEMLGQVAQEPLGSEAVQHGRNAQDQHGVAAEALDFERAAEIRDRIKRVKDQPTLFTVPAATESSASNSKQ